MLFRSTIEQQEQYRRDGYIILPGFKGADEIAALRARAVPQLSLGVALAAKQHVLPVGTTGDQDESSPKLASFNRTHRGISAPHMSEKRINCV